MTKLDHPDENQELFGKAAAVFLRGLPTQDRGWRRDPATHARGADRPRPDFVSSPMVRAARTAITRRAGEPRPARARPFGHAHLTGIASGRPRWRRWLHVWSRRNRESRPATSDPPRCGSFVRRPRLRAPSDLVASSGSSTAIVVPAGAAIPRAIPSVATWRWTCSTCDQGARRRGFHHHPTLFDNRFYFDFVCAPARPHHVPIVLASCPSPTWRRSAHDSDLRRSVRRLAGELERRRTDKAAVAQLGVAQATAQCVDLLLGGAPGCTLYAEPVAATRMILTVLKARCNRRTARAATSALPRRCA